MTIERADAQGVIHSFPDGTSDAVIQRITGTSHAVPSAPQRPVRKTEPLLPNALGAGLQGLSMGFSDEIIAKLRAMGEKDPDAYQRYVQAERAGMHKYSQENPMTSMAAELGGGLIPTVGMALTGAGAPAAGANAARMAPSIARMMGIGAGTGAVSGVGTSEKPATLGNMAEDATTGAIVGGGVSGAFGGLGRYVAKPAWNMVKSTFGFGDPESAANKAIAGALKKDGHSVNSVQSTIDALGRGEITLADLGENTRNLLKKATQAPGETRNKALAVLAERADQRVPRIGEDLQALMSGSKDFFTDLEKMKLARAAKAGPLYESAYKDAKAIVPDATLKFFKAPTFLKAFKEAQTVMHDRGLDPNAPENHLRALHEAKRVLDGWSSAAYRSGDGRLYGDLKDMTKALLHDMEKDYPDYKLARKVYAGESSIMDAAKQGSEIYGMSEPEIRSMVKKFSDNPSELDAMRAGIAQSMLEKVRGSPDARPIRSVLGGDNERKLRMAFQDDNAFEEFKKRMLAEERMKLTERQDDKAAPVDPENAQGGSLLGAAKNAATGNFGNAAMNMIDTALPRMTGMPPQVAQRTTQKLLTPTGQSGTGMDPILEGIMATLKADEANIARMGTASNIAGAVAGQQGAAQPPSMQGGINPLEAAGNVMNGEGPSQAPQMPQGMQMPPSALQQAAPQPMPQ